MMILGNQCFWGELKLAVHFLIQPEAFWWHDVKEADPHGNRLIAVIQR